MITDSGSLFLSKAHTSFTILNLESFYRCDSEIQKLVSSQTFEDLITTQNGMLVSRALVNVVIDQQIGQQISVRASSIYPPCHLT